MHGARAEQAHFRLAADQLYALAQPRDARQGVALDLHRPRKHQLRVQNGFHWHVLRPWLGDVQDPFREGHSLSLFEGVLPDLLLPDGVFGLSELLVQVVDRALVLEGLGGVELHFHLEDSRGRFLPRHSEHVINAPVAVPVAPVVLEGDGLHPLGLKPLHGGLDSLGVLLRRDHHRIPERVADLPHERPDVHLRRVLDRLGPLLPRPLLLPLHGQGCLGVRRLRRDRRPAQPRP
mmetsp:Transcript_11348/g.26660  ORF Transcript_11348/g.26660 Transcript_11348/m.26660 type:complete len:234 (-) Transcript_11348:57-758(-)